MSSGRCLWQRIAAQLHSYEVMLLQAIRLDVYDRFQYRIDVDDGRSFLASDSDDAITLLSRLGVADGARLLAHVREWGSIELPGPAQPLP